MSPTDSGALHTTTVGDAGPLVVFLHGLFGQGKNWTSIAKALAGEQRSLLVDLPEHGRSPWSDQFSYRAMADAVADTVAEQVRRAGDSRVAVVGHSMGGKVAMALALAHPRLVERLCVVDIAPVRYERLSNFAEYVRGMRALDLDTVPDRTAADAGLEPYVPDPTIRSFLLQNLRRDGSRWQWQMNLDLLGDSLPDLGDWPELDVDPYPGPVLWMAGADSDYITAERAAAMRTLFPQTLSLTIKRAGHWVHAEQPAIFVDALRRFLEPLRSSHEKEL